jgi:hypothetical protein
VFVVLYNLNILSQRLKIILKEFIFDQNSVLKLIRCIIGACKVGCSTSVQYSMVRNRNNRVRHKWVRPGICYLGDKPHGPNLSDLAECVILCTSWLQSPVLVVLNKLVKTFGKKSNLKCGLIRTRQLR